ncbi:SOS response-associated peptidase [Sulfurimonas sp.]|jgi:putative SOS response-associated peptidase YedK|uniref:SOS response-associated peptidase n=1 Tax=Sulfurimonas sp. TaxID=2022749 RepID=UPI0025FE2790|nr:SOS response-associated peptidase [Sulfurimonas sp.]MBT5934282.1 SOS response-associated peptidase [Sulfurimonas sp.]
MPGRLCMFDDFSFKQDITQKFGVFRDTIGILNKQYNIAPTLNIAMYTNNKVYEYAHFGLIPSWAKERSSMQINARSETVFEKSSFKEAYKQRRCLIPLNGYFEWKKDTQSKKSQAHFILSTTANYFVFAGIYESWYDNALGKPILTCALLTTEPNEKISGLHDRMPVILESHQWELWLDNKSSYRELNRLFIPLSSDKIRYFPVSEYVNSVKNDSLMCITENLKTEPRQGTLF